MRSAICTPCAPKTTVGWAAILVPVDVGEPGPPDGRSTRVIGWRIPVVVGAMAAVAVGIAHGSADDPGVTPGLGDAADYGAQIAFQTQVNPIVDQLVAADSRKSLVSVVPDPVSRSVSFYWHGAQIPALARALAALRDAGISAHVRDAPYSADQLSELTERIAAGQATTNVSMISNLRDGSGVEVRFSTADFYAQAQRYLDAVRSNGADGAGRGQSSAYDSLVGQEGGPRILLSDQPARLQDWESK